MRFLFLFIIGLLSHSPLIFVICMAIEYFCIQFFPKYEDGPGDEPAGFWEKK